MDELQEQKNVRKNSQSPFDAKVSAIGKQENRNNT